MPAKKFSNLKENRDNAKDQKGSFKDQVQDLSIHLDSYLSFLILVHIHMNLSPLSHIWHTRYSLLQQIIHKTAQHYCNSKF